MAASKTVFLLACDKHALELALGAFAGEEELRAGIAGVLRESGECDTNVTFSEPQVAFICERLVPWAQGSLQLGGNERTRLAKTVLATIPARLQ